MTETNLGYSEFVSLVLDAFESADVPYLIGGAVAAWAWGEPRATRDLDLVIQIAKGVEVKLSEKLAKRNMLLPVDIIQDRLKDRRGDDHLNVIHATSGYKADLYLVSEGDLFRNEVFRRRVLVDLGPGLGELYLHTPEDLILYKLMYYSVSQQTKHISDIASIVQTMGDTLDAHYIQKWVAEKDLSTIWKSVQFQIQSNK